MAYFTGLPWGHLQLQSQEPVGVIPIRSPDEHHTYIFTEDYRHDVYDVTTGSIIGAMVAIYSYVCGLSHTQLHYHLCPTQYIHADSFLSEEIFSILDITECRYSIHFENS